MNEVLSEFSVGRQEASLSRGDLRVAQTEDVFSVALRDLVHDLRQPLGVIESLAYYLELRSTDEKASTQLQRIRAMVGQANRILELASVPVALPNH